MPAWFTALVQLVASGVAYLATRGIDAIVGKWVAAVVIGFERAASSKARAAYSQALDDSKRKMADGARQWAEWRRQHGLEN
jgi:hypothetical protein